MDEALKMSNESMLPQITIYHYLIVQSVLSYEPKNELILEYQKALKTFIRQGIEGHACHINFHVHILL